MEKEDSWLLKIFIEESQEWWFVSNVSEKGKMEAGNGLELGKRYKTKQLIEKQIERMKEKGWKTRYEIVSLKEEKERTRLKTLEENEGEFMKRLKEKRQKESLQNLRKLLDD